MEEQNSLFFILSFSMFSDVKGPVPVYCYPESIEESTRVEIAMKSVSLLMGEAVYQAGLSDDLNFFGVLPFPDLNYIGLTYFFLIPDETARGKSKAATITFIVKESDHNFIYNNIHTLRILLDKTKVHLCTYHDPAVNRQILEDLRLNIANIHNSSMGQNKHSRLKILIAGLNKSGKTTFRTAINTQYSELITTTSAKGHAFSKHERIPKISALEWNFRDPPNDRSKRLSNSALSLNDTDLLFYIIDMQDLGRLKESLIDLSQILQIFENFHKYPLIQIALHKSDPDFVINPLNNGQIWDFKSIIVKLYPKWDLKVFLTSIYDPLSLLNCISYGFFHLYPNKTRFSNILETFVQKIKGHIGILLTKNALVLGKFSINSIWLEFADNIKENLYDMFLNSEDLSDETTAYQKTQIDGVNLVFYRLIIDENEFYLLYDSPYPLSMTNRQLKKFQKKIIPLLREYIG